MQKRVLKNIFGFFVMLLGLILILNSLSNITGLVILSKSLNKSFYKITGFILIFIGAIILQIRLEESGLEKRVERLNKLLKEIREIIKSGKVSSYKDLKSYAIKAGLNPVEGKEHTLYKDASGYTWLNIPRGKKETIGVYRKNLKNLYQYLQQALAA
ncbi:MAG: hypothetical protein QXF25_01005 [Candidatus Pacearchaeota archaeon]